MKPFSSRCTLAAALLLCLLGAQKQPQAHPAISAQIDELDHAIQAAPDQAELLLRRAELFRQYRQWPAALRDLDAAERLSPEAALTTRLNYQRARLFQQMKQTDQALELIERYLATNPSDPDAHRLLAHILRDLGQTEKAIAAARDALRLNARPSPDDYIELASIENASGDSQSAVATLDLGISRLGPIVSLQLAAIAIDEQAGEFTAALQRLDALGHAGMQEESRLVRRARVLSAAGRHEEARKDCRQAQALLMRDAQRRTLPANRNLLTEIAAILAGSKASTKLAKSAP